MDDTFGCNFFNRPLRAYRRHGNEDRCNNQENRNYYNIRYRVCSGNCLRMYNGEDVHGNSPLHYAVLRGDLNFIEQHGHEYILFINDDYQTALHAAIDADYNISKKIKVVKVLLSIISYYSEKERYDFLHQFCRSKTALLLALKRGYVGIVKILIRAGADVTLLGHNCLTSLHYIVRSPDILDYKTRTALIRLILDDLKDMKKYKRKYREYGDCWRLDFINKIEKLRLCTALNVALERGFFEIAEMLMDAGADVAVFNKYAVSSLHALLLYRGSRRQYAKNLFIRILESISREKKYKKKRIQFINTIGVNVINEGNEYFTALELAAKGGWIDFIDLLLSNGADIRQGTPICWALCIEDKIARLKMIKYLISKGARVNVADMFGCSPIHSQFICSDLEAKIFLIEHGASVLFGKRKVDEGVAVKSEQKKIETLLQNVENSQLALQEAIKKFMIKGGNITDIKEFFLSKDTSVYEKMCALDVLVQKEQREKINVDLRELYRCVRLDLPEFMYGACWHYAFVNRFYDCNNKTAQDALLDNAYLLLEFPEYIPHILINSGLYEHDTALKQLIAPRYYGGHRYQEQMKHVIKKGSQNVLLSLLRARELAQKRGNKDFVLTLCNTALWMYRMKKGCVLSPRVAVFLTGFINPEMHGNLFIIDEQDQIEELFKKSECINERNDEGFNKVHEVIIKGCYKSLRAILEHYRDENMLHLALRQKRVSIESEYPNKTPIGMALAEVIEANKKEVVKALLRTKNRHTGRTLLEQVRHDKMTDIESELVALKQKFEKKRYKNKMEKQLF